MKKVIVKIILRNDMLLKIKLYNEYILQISSYIFNEICFPCKLFRKRIHALDH